MFKKIYLVILLLSLIFTSCNKEDSSNLPDTNETEETDETNETDSTLIGDFELSITNITLYTAQLDWTEADNAENYEVYLDEMLLESNVSDFQYTIVGLEKGTSHQVKVIAKNTENSLEKTSSFTTLEEANLLVKSIEVPRINNGGTFFTYDNNNKLIKKEILICSQNYGELFTLSEYEYNSDGKLLKEISNSPYGNLTYTIDYFYNNNLLSRIEKSETFTTGGSAIYEYLFSSETEYTMEIQYFDTNGNPTNNKFFNCLITKNNDNRIIAINKNQSNGPEYRNYNFTYENGNLVEIYFGDQYLSTAATIEYDSKPNFHKYFSGTEFPGSSGNSCLRWDIAGLIWLEYFRGFDGFFDILPFYRNSNLNNPTSYNNGDLEFAYEYNEYDYPRSISFQPYNNPIVEILELTYEVIE